MGLFLKICSLVTLVHNWSFVLPSTLKNVLGLGVACLLTAVLAARSDSMPYYLVLHAE
jgi:hypothetical protein